MVNTIISCNVIKGFTLDTTVYKLLFQTISNMSILLIETKYIREYIVAIRATIASNLEVDENKFTFSLYITNEIVLRTMNVRYDLMTASWIS